MECEEDGGDLAGIIVNDKPLSGKVDNIDTIFEDSPKESDVTLQHLETPSQAMDSPAIKNKKKFISGF
jgi:hypothetical protein